MPLHSGFNQSAQQTGRYLSWRPDNESLCFEHDAPYAGISLREQLFITNIVLMPLQNRRGCCPSADHPTRFCQAPNRFDKDAVKDIMPMMLPISTSEYPPTVRFFIPTFLDIGYIRNAPIPSGTPVTI